MKHFITVVFIIFNILTSYGGLSHNSILDTCCTGRRLLVITDPSMGLTNQLIAWAGIVALGIKTKRNVCILGFNTDIGTQNANYNYEDLGQWMLNISIRYIYLYNIYYAH